MNRLNKEASVIEELNGVRCAIVEKNVSPERVEFLKKLLEHNGYTVLIAQTPPPLAKPAPKPPVPVVGADGQIIPPPPLPPLPIAIGTPPSPAPNTFSVGVTNISFHAMLAIYERSLFTPEGKIVSIAYWNEEPEKEGELYWQRRKK